MPQRSCRTCLNPCPLAGRPEHRFGMRSGAEAPEIDLTLRCVEFNIHEAVQRALDSS